MNYRLTLTDGTERFFGYAGEILQFAESEWPQRSCKFAPVLLVSTGVDQWQLQGIDMRVLGRVDRSDEPWLSRQLTPVDPPQRILEGEILGPEPEIKWFVLDSLASLIGMEVSVNLNRKARRAERARK